MLPPGLIHATPGLRAAASPRRAVGRLQQAAVLPPGVLGAGDALRILTGEPLDPLTTAPGGEVALGDSLDRLAHESQEVGKGGPVPDGPTVAIRPLVPRPMSAAASAGKELPDVVVPPGPVSQSPRAALRPAGGVAAPPPAAAVAPTGPRGGSFRPVPPTAPPPVPAGRVPRPPTGAGRSGPALDDLPTPWPHTVAAAPSPPSPALARFAAVVPGGLMAAATPVAVSAQHDRSQPRPEAVAPIRGDAAGPARRGTRRAAAPQAAVAIFPTLLEPPGEQAPSIHQGAEHQGRSAAPGRGLAGLSRWWNEAGGETPSGPDRPAHPVDHVAPIDPQGLADALGKLFLAEARRYGIEVDES